MENNLISQEIKHSVSFNEYLSDVISHFVDENRHLEAEYGFLLAFILQKGLENEYKTFRENAHESINVLENEYSEK